MLGQPTVTVGPAEIVTSMISDHAVTPVKLSQQTGGGFLGRTASTLGDISFVQFTDGNITWPTHGIALSDSTTTEFTMGVTNAHRMRMQYNPSSSGTLDLNVASLADAAVGDSTGDVNWKSGSVTFTPGGSGTSQSFALVRQALGGSFVYDIRLGTGAPSATTDTAGFPFLPTMAGTPTGVTATGGAACVVDTSANKLWIRVAGTWKYAALT